MMPEVGQAIRDAYRRIGVEDCTPIFSYLNNAEGHGTDEAMLEYCTLHAERFNMICIHQQPRSPATNMLVLRVCMALQFVVEKLHHNKLIELNSLC